MKATTKDRAITYFERSRDLANSKSEVVRAPWESQTGYPVHQLSCTKLGDDEYDVEQRSCKRRHSRRHKDKNRSCNLSTTRKKPLVDLKVR